jgi:flavin-dependent dehydrogenase
VSDYDVAILGGGLAGLTLALQLKRERPRWEADGLLAADGVSLETARERLGDGVDNLFVDEQAGEQATS